MKVIKKTEFVNLWSKKNKIRHCVKNIKKQYRASSEESFTHGDRLLLLHRH